MMLRRVSLALLLAASCAAPPPAAPPAAADAESVLDALEERAREVLAAIEHPADRASLERAVPRLRERLRASLGEPSLPPGGARGVGTLDFDGYRLEKLVFGGFGEVPAHLYLPAGAGPFPAVLHVPGHWWADSKSKTDFQRLNASLARRGIAVLTYDPIGQGERGISWRDHRRTESLLHGTAQMGLALAEARRALDVLCADSRIDRDRIGITGASGGGYTSWILPALDERIKVSVPCVGTSEFLEQIRAVRERDWYDAKEHCHFVPGLLRYANNHEFAALIAPRPLLVISAHNDHSFRLPGIREVVGYAKSLYSALGSPDRVAYLEDDSEGHGYGKRKREGAVGWLLKWLKGEGDGAPAPEPDFVVPAWDAAELRCLPENRGAGRAIAARFSALPPGKRVTAPQLESALGLPLPSRLTSAPRMERSGQELRWRMRDGVVLPGTLLEPEGGWDGVLLAASDAGRATLREQPLVRDALKSGYAVVAVDVRGTGELDPRKPGWIFGVSLLLGENFVGRQAMDLVACWRSLYAMPSLRGKGIRLHGSGPAMSLAARYAAILEPRIGGAGFDDGLFSFREMAKRPEESFRLSKAGGEKDGLDREILSYLVPWNVAGKFDVPDLAASALGAKDPEGPFRLGSNPSTLVPRGGMPARVHVQEDYETDIEKRWWLAGRLETGDVPSDSRRACRATLANDFDDKMGDPARIYSAVIFNPVPGPPMGPATRLAFRYKLLGTDSLRVQIYSLSNGYHRHLTLSGLPQGGWREACVDMTKLRRPDGSGGPLSDGERIDDIQFYADPAADFLIDDVVLYEAGDPHDWQSFPRRVVFCGGFDTGAQGREWPGRFSIVPHEKPRTWKAAQSKGAPLVVDLRGERAVFGPELWLQLLARRRGTGLVTVDAGQAGERPALSGLDPGGDGWKLYIVRFTGLKSVRELRFEVPEGVELTIDDLILYEPATK